MDAVQHDRGHVGQHFAAVVGHGRIGSVEIAVGVLLGRAEAMDETIVRANVHDVLAALLRSHVVGVFFRVVGILGHRGGRIDPVLPGVHQRVRLPWRAGRNGT